MVRRKSDAAKKPAPSKKTKPVKDDLEDDQSLIDAIGSADPALDQGAGADGPEVLIDPGGLSLVGSSDAAAAAKASKTDPDHPAGRSRSPISPGSDEKPAAGRPAKPPEVPPEVKAYLNPGAIEDLVCQVNTTLMENKSPWAAYPGQAKNIGRALEAVIDKYFPRSGEWAPELVLGVLAAVYVLPRWSYIGKKSEASDPNEEKTSRPATADNDDRLHDVAA